MGGGGLLDQVGIRLSQLPTKLKLKLSLAISELATAILGDYLMASTQGSLEVAQIYLPRWGRRVGPMAIQ